MTDAVELVEDKEAEAEINGEEEEEEEETESAPPSKPKKDAAISAEVRPHVTPRIHRCGVDLHQGRGKQPNLA